MLRCRKFIIGAICFSIIASAITSYAEEEIEDLIDIAESKKQNYRYYRGNKDSYL